MNTPETDQPVVKHLETALAAALSSMTGKQFTVTAESAKAPVQLDKPFIWQQSFSFERGPALWVSAGKDLWETAGALTMASVGVDSSTEEDYRSTWQEILGQTMGSLATGLTSDLQREILNTKGEEIASEPSAPEWTVFSVRHDDDQVWLVKAGWLPALTALYEQSQPTEQKSGMGASTFSKTFDLLLDVALPVSVSFGKTSLQIREVLKLNTGSVVELNRLVAEPVDVVVNDCVIARGEVVVVDGNYGVRVTHLASREDRMRFGMAETSRNMAGTGVVS